MKLLQLKMGWTSPSTWGPSPVPACPTRKYHPVTEAVGSNPAPYCEDDTSTATHSDLFKERSQPTKRVYPKKPTSEKIIRTAGRLYT